eukprot:gene13560-28776_t
MKATFASEEVLKKNDCEIINDNTLKYKNWTFSTSHNPIFNHSELITLARKISNICKGKIQPDDDTLLMGDTHLHVPAMIFGNNFLSVTHKSSNGNEIGVLFDACDALSGWALQHCKTDGDDSSSLQLTLTSDTPPKPPTSTCPIPRMIEFKVPTSTSWLKQHQQQRSSTTSTSTDEDQLTKRIVSYWDWTFTTDYCYNTLPINTANVEVEVEIEDVKIGEWKRCEPGGVDDDLEDCGEVFFNVK